MVRIGGIEESELRALIRSELQDHLSFSDEDVRQVVKRLEELEERLQSDAESVQKDLSAMHERVDKLSSLVAKRPETEAQIQALQLNLKQKADLAEVIEKMNRLEIKMERKVEADLTDLSEKLNEVDGRMERKLEAADLEGAMGGMEGRVSVLLSSKADGDDLDDKIRSLYERMEKVEASDVGNDASELLERLVIAEQCLQDKADNAFLDSQVNALKQAIHLKADNNDVVERFEDIKQRLRIKAEVASVDEKLSVLHQRLHRKVEASEVQACEDRLDRFEHRLEETQDFETIMERIEMLERKMAQKADNAAIDASLDDMDQRLQMKADDSTVQDRLNGVDCRLQSKADAQIVSSRLGGLEQRLMREAEDIHHIKQELSTKVDASFVSATVTANQVYIMQEVETMNITQNKQFNVMNNHGTGPSASNGPSGSSTPLQEPRPKNAIANINYAEQDTRVKMALQNGGSSDQLQAPSRGSGQRALARSNRDSYNKAALQPPPQQHSFSLQRPLASLGVRTPRSKSVPRMGRPAVGQSEMPVGGRCFSRPASRSVSRGRAQGTLPGIADSPEGQQLRTPSRSTSLARPRPEPVLGPTGWRAPDPDERARAASSLECRGPSPERQPHWGPGVSPLCRGDTTPPRYRSRTPDSVTPNTRSRSVTPGSEYGFEGTLTPPKNMRNGGGSGAQAKSMRIWACKRM